MKNVMEELFLNKLAEASIIEDYLADETWR